MPQSLRSFIKLSFFKQKNMFNKVVLFNCEKLLLFYLLITLTLSNKFERWGQNKNHRESGGFLGLWELRDSNPRPSACKADALNQLS